MANILLVEDEALIAEAVSAYLKRAGHRPVVEHNGINARDRFNREEFDLILLDLMIPGMSGEELCRYIRSKSPIPVLMLTAKSDEASLLYGFRIGADDYLTKPFSPRELIVRVDALLRRAGTGAKAGFIDFGDGLFRLDVEKKILYKSGRKIHLTPIEYDILEKLITFPGRIFSREEIICAVLGVEFDGNDRTIDSHIRNLRAKIEDDRKNPRFILTRRGLGFCYEG